MGVMSLGVGQGVDVILSVEGADATMQSLLSLNYGKEGIRKMTEMLKGIAAFDGVAVAKHHCSTGFIILRFL